MRSIPRPDQRVDELEPITGVMPEAIDPPSGCRFHTRCPEAREVCPRVEPTYQEVADGHHVSCVKYEDVGYDESPPLDTEATNAFGAGDLVEHTGNAETDGGDHE